MGESRTELIAWLNDLLQLSYTKVEQAGTSFNLQPSSRPGTGAAYCQVMDSIYGDVPLARCKFNAKYATGPRRPLTPRQEYEYLANYKVLQNTFKAHGIDKVSQLSVHLCQFDRADPQLTRRTAHSSRQAHQMQDAGQSRVPPVVQAILGLELSRRGVRRRRSSSRRGHVLCVSARSDPNRLPFLLTLISPRQFRLSPWAVTSPARLLTRGMFSGVHDGHTAAICKVTRHWRRQTPCDQRKEGSSYVSCPPAVASMVPLTPAALPRAGALGSGSRSASSQPDQALVALTQQMNEMKITVEGLEKERDFYFNKVRRQASPFERD